MGGPVVTEPRLMVRKVRPLKSTLRSAAQQGCKTGEEQSSMRGLAVDEESFRFYVLTEY